MLRTSHWLLLWTLSTMYLALCELQRIRLRLTWEQLKAENLHFWKFKNVHPTQGRERRPGFYGSYDDKEKALITALVVYLVMAPWITTRFYFLLFSTHRDVSLFSPDLLVWWFVVYFCIASTWIMLDDREEQLVSNTRKLVIVYIVLAPFFLFMGSLFRATVILAAAEWSMFVLEMTHCTQQQRAAILYRSASLGLNLSGLAAAALFPIDWHSQLIYAIAGYSYVGCLCFLLVFRLVMFSHMLETANGIPYVKYEDRKYL